MATPNGHSSTPARPPGTPTSTTTAQEAIAQNARRIVRGWPVGAALDGGLDTIAQLDPILIANPTFFPPPSSSSSCSTSGTLFHDPQLDAFQREYQALLGAGSKGGEIDAQTEQWRVEQVRRALQTREMQGSLLRREGNGDPAYGSLPPLRPPYPVNPAAAPFPLYTTPNSLSSLFLAQSSFPPPPPPSDSTLSQGSNPLQPRQLQQPPPLGPTTGEQDSPQGAIEALIRETMRAARPPPPPQTPTHPRTSQLSAGASQLRDRNGGGHGMVPTSSPDPLLLMHDADESTSTSRIVAVGSQPGRLSQGGAGGGGTQILPSLPRKRSTSSELSSHFSSPLKPASPSMTSAPALEPGFESAVKRVKLESSVGASVATTNTNSASRSSSMSMHDAGGPTSTGGKTVGLEAVEKIGDLVSDLFGADDALVGDTSSAALANRSPSRKQGSGPRYFRATAVGATSGNPLVHTDTIRRLLSLWRTVKSRRKGEELLNEVEGSGIARVLKLLERSWEGVGGDGWEGWEKEALMRREEADTAGAGAGAGGKKGKKAGCASPAKGRGGAATTTTTTTKGKGSKKGRSSLTPSGGDGGDQDPDDGDFNMRVSNSPLKAVRRSTRSPSPRPGAGVAPAEDDSGWQDGGSAPSTTAGAAAGDERDETYWTAERLGRTKAALRDLSDALLAARLALEILTLPGVTLPKHLFSSEYLLGLVTTLRHALDDFFLPSLIAPSTSPVHELALEAGLARDQIAEVCDALVQAVQVLADLTRREELSEDLVVALSYLSLEPFFHDAPTLPGRASAASTTPVAASVKSLRLAALAVLQTVYARYTDQQAWIVEEVLGNLGKAELVSGGGGSAAKKAKGGIRIRTGATIQTVSTLLLHLVQTCPADLPAQIRKRFAQRRHKNGIKLDEVDEDDDFVMKDRTADVLGGQRDENDAEDGEDEEIFSLIHRRFVAPALDASNRTARTIVGFLLQRAAKAGKAAGVAADAEYRAVLDHLVSDLLATLHLPEWPGSNILLVTLCRSMMATLADPKASHENNALKGLSLDHLGNVIAHIRSLTSDKTTPLASLSQIIATTDTDALEKVAAAQKAILNHLDQAETSNTQEQGVTRFCRLEYANDLLQALATARTVVETPKLAQLVRQLEHLSEQTWQENAAEDVFGPSSDAAQPRIDAIALDLWRTSTLPSMYHALIERILDACESPQVTLRTKAMRAVSHVVAQDPSLFQQDFVRRGIESRMLDASPAVRDASVELVGKYVVSNPALAMQYLPKICDRIADSGLSVRRRVVKLLKVLFGVIDDEATRVDICRKLVCRVLDEDDGIKELAVDAIEELWFGAARKTHTTDSAQLARIITLTCGSAEDRPPPVDDAMRLIMAKHVEKGTEPPLDRLREVVETLVDCLVENKNDMDLVSGIKTVYILSAVDPSLLSTAKATLLLPFLKSATTADERIISDYLLKMFRSAMLAMPRSSSKFGRDLQAALVPMLNKPSNSVSTLQDVVACFCAVVHSQTQDYATMIRVFRATLGRLNSETQKLGNAQTAAQVNQRSLPILCYMSALLCEHGRFDDVRRDHPDAKPAIDQVTPASIAELTFTLLIRLHGLDTQPSVKAAVLTSLGFVFRTHPVLMINEASTNIIDAVFDAPEIAPRLQLLRIIQDFLLSQEQVQAAAAAATTRPKTKQKSGGAASNGVEMDELVGNVEGFAESGVASAVAQRYLRRINEAALSHHIALQRIAVDLLSAIARSGFSHPITLSPTLAALTASADSQLAAKAFSALALLHQKHTSILASRFLDSVRAIHAYVLAGVADQPARGYRIANEGVTESLLGRWYSLLQKEKRQIQLDCLKSLGRAFEVEAGAACSQDAVSFARFLAEALSCLDYKRTEEPLMVVSQLNSALAVSGLQVVHALEQGMQGGGGLVARASMSPSKQPSENGVAASANEAAPAVDLARQSVVSGLALLLRDHLKQLYSLTDAKIAKYLPGKKSAMGDRPVTHRSEVPAALGMDSYERMPFALARMTSPEDLSSQRANYLRLISEDGTIGNLDELEAETADGTDP
ncbi:hypothetical protein JCM10908_000358 [Rhodotorula pacifica]|uniref:cohesin-loading factor complex subunit SCC2 n=1 Tax=Rhodotorula pacifica TaxID=1495444 RepID=UPI003174EDE4